MVELSVLSEGDVELPHLLVVGLWPNPKLGPVPALTGRSGRRLMELAGRRGELWTVCRTTNLYSKEPKVASFKDVAERVQTLIDQAARRDFREVVFLGAVAARGSEYFTWYSRPETRAVWAYSPHPSGVSRWWNDPMNVHDAERFWGDLLDPV